MQVNMGKCRIRKNYVISTIGLIILTLVYLCRDQESTVNPESYQQSISKEEALQMEVEEESVTILNSALYQESLPLQNQIREFEMRAYFDESGKYKILPHVHVATSWELNQRPLGVAVQSSLDRAHLIVELATSWPGIISLALFAPGSEFNLTFYYIAYLKHCFPFVKERVNIHLVYPNHIKVPTALYMELYTKMSKWNCSDTPEVPLKFLLDLRAKKTTVWRQQLLYPQNVLRNVARYHCQNEWVMCPDIDMLFPLPNPSDKNTMERLEEFLLSNNTRQCGEKCAYVFPLYEIHESCDHIPSNKTELLKYIREKHARQYHITIFKPNQALAQLTKWEKKTPEKEIKVAHPIGKFKFWFEPVYIAKRGTPKFDERYLGFGMVRNTQAYEMSLAGYEFHLLDNIFLSHWKFQEMTVYSKSRKHQNDENFKIFYRQHIRELAVRYDSDPENLLNTYRKRAEEDNKREKRKYNIEVSVKNK